MCHRSQYEKEAALKTYPERADLGHWCQEVFIGLLNTAKLKEELKYSNDEIIAAYMEATAACLTRAEALYSAARFCRIKGIYERGYQLAVQGLAIAHPRDGLAVEDWIYDYGLIDEFTVHAYWTARYAECVDACNRLLSEGKLPAGMRDRVLKNASSRSRVGDYQPISINCLLLLLTLWVCGQRACVVHHVHSVAARLH
jgi:hypothetical protein